MNCYENAMFVLFVQLPADMSKLSESERIARLEKRKPKKKVLIEEDVDDSYDINRYSHLWNKKK